MMQLKKGGKASFIPFVVAGSPSLELCEQAIEVLIAEGADVIELGVPFSDAMADGPVIQTASEKAARTVSLKAVLELAKRVLAKHPGFPLVLFSYYNPILKMGLEKFADQAKATGIAAVLVVDLPPEEAGLYCQILGQRELGTVFLASPTTSEERLKRIAEASSAFIYLVSRAGVTGEQKELSGSLASEVAKVRKVTDKSVAIGFGISKSDQARAVAKLGDAVVVGSAFVRILSSGEKPDLVLKQVRELARDLATASHSG